MERWGVAVKEALVSTASPRANRSSVGGISESGSTRSTWSLVSAFNGMVGIFASTMAPINLLTSEMDVSQD